MCRYAGRPAVNESRLAELPNCRIGYARKRRWRDGTTAVVITNAVLMERLCALVPPPHKHLVTYHGVLAPVSGLRPKVVPRQTTAGEEEAEGAAADCRHGAGGGGFSEAAEANNAATPAAAARRLQCACQKRERAYTTSSDGARHTHRGSRLAARGSRLAARGSRLAARGSRLAARGSP
ncbi:MAG: transposase [Planctomycetota bacterium]